MPSTGASAGGAGGSGPRVTIPIVGDVVNESDISREIYNAFALALGKVFTSPAFSKGMLRMGQQMGKQMERAFAKSAAEMSKTLNDIMGKGASKASGTVNSAMSHMVPHNLTAAIDRLIGQFNRLETAAKKASTPDINMERVLERLNRQATVATTEGARQQTAALNSALQNQAAATNAAAKQRVAVIQAMSNQIRALERGLGAAIKFSLEIAGKAVHALGAALRGIGNAARAGSRASAAALRGITTAVQGVIRGVARLSTALASGLARGMAGASRAIASALRRDENALRSSLSRRERMVSQSATRQGGILSRLGGGGLLGGVAAGGGIFGLLTSGFERAGAEERLQLAFATLLGSGEEAQAMLASLSEYARTTAFDFVGISEAVIQMTAAFGGDVAEGDRLTRMLADMVALTGGGNAQFERAALAFQQIAAAGGLYGDELRQLGESLPGVPVTDILVEKFFGGDRDAFAKAKAAGELGGLITSDAFFQALEEGMQERFPGFEGFAQQAATTLTGRLANLKESFSVFGAEIIRLFEGPLKDVMERTTTILQTLGGFISGDMFKPAEEVPNPFADMAADTEVLIKDLPEEFQAALAAMGFEGPFVSAGDAAQWWEDNMAAPAEVDETIERLKELRDVIGDFVKGTGLILGLAAAFKVLGAAFNFAFRPQLLGRFGLLVRTMLPLVAIGGGLGVVWGRMIKASPKLASSVKLVGQQFGNLFGTFKKTLGIVGGLLSNAIFGDSDFFTKMGDRVADFTNDVGRLVGLLNSWLKWANDMLEQREFGKVIDRASQSVQSFVASILGLTDAQQEAAQALGGNDFGNIFTAFLDKLEDVPVLGPVIRFVRRIVDAISNALGGVGGFFTDIWGAIFGDGETMTEAADEAMGRSDSRNAGQKILDRLEDTFLGPIVRFFRGPFADGVESAISGIGDFVGGIVSWVDEGGLGRAWTAVSGFLAPIFNTIADVVTSAWARIQPIVQPLIDEVQKLFDAFKNWDFSEIDVGELVRNALIGGIAGFAIGGLPGLAIGGLAGVLFDPLVESIGNAWDMEIRPALEGVFDKLKAWFGSTFTAENLGGAATFILDFFREAGRLVAGIATDPVFVGAVAGVAAAAGLVVVFFTLGLVEGLLAAIVDWTDLIGKALELAWEAIAPEFLPDPIVDAISAVLGNALTGMVALVGGLAIGKLIVTSIIGGITQLAPALISGAGGLVGLIFGRTPGANATGQQAAYGGFKSVGSAIAGSIAAGFLAFKFGEAAGRSDSDAAVMLSILSGGAAGAAIGIGAGPAGAAIGAVLGAAAAGAGVFFGKVSRDAENARERVADLKTELLDVAGLEVLGGLDADAAEQVVSAEFRERLIAIGAQDAADWGDSFLDNIDFGRLAEQALDEVPPENALVDYVRNLGDEVAAASDVTEAQFQSMVDDIVQLMRDGGFTLEEALNDPRGKDLRELLNTEGVDVSLNDLRNILGFLQDAFGDTAAAAEDIAWGNTVQGAEDAAAAIDTVEEAVTAINDALARGDSAAQITAMLQASGLGPTEALEAVATASDDVRDAAQEAKAALDEIFDMQVSPDTLVGATAQIISGITSINFEGLNLNIPEGDVINAADVEQVRSRFAGQIEDAINTAVDSGVVVDEAGISELLGRISTAINQAPDLTAGERDFLQEILDSYTPGEVDYSSVFDPLGTATIGEDTLGQVTTNLESGLAPAIDTGITGAINLAGPMAVATLGAAGSPTMNAITAAAKSVGTHLKSEMDTAVTGALTGIGGGGGTAAVGITPPSDTGGIGSGLVDSVVGAIEDGAGAVQAAAQALGAAFARGIAGTARQAAAAARVSAVLASVNFNRGQGAAYSAGQNLARSFANGIRSMAFAVAMAAAAIAQAAINAARATLQMFSPSKVFVGIGKEVGESFMSGIEETEGDMASAMSEAISNAIDRVTNTAQAAAAEAGSAIFSALIPSILPGGTPTSTIQSANAAIRQQIGGFTAGLRESAAGGLGTQAAAATQQAAAALRIMSTEFTVAQREIRAEVAEAIAHRDDIEEWIEAMAELRENEASGALGLALFNEEVAELRVQLNAGLMTQEQYNDALDELNKKLKAGILNQEAYNDALDELGDRPEPLTLRELNLIASGAQSTNLGTFAGQANFDAINEALGAIQSYADAAIESGVAVGSVAGTVNAYVQNLRAAAQRSGLALTEVDNWIRAMGLMPGQIAVWTASLTSLNIATAAGQTNIQMINEQLEAIRSYGIQLIEAGYAAGTVQSELARLTQSLVSQATAFGFNATSINQLVAAAGLSTTALAAFVAEMQAFTVAARDAEAAAAAAAAAAELARQEEAAAAITPVGRPVVENLNVYLPYGDPEAAGLAAANHIAYSTLTSW